MALRAIKSMIRDIGDHLGVTGGRSAREIPIEEGSDWYDRMYAANTAYHCEYNRSRYYFLWTVIADRIRRGGLRKILEVGCGPGQLARLLLDQGIGGYVGLDFSATAIEMARRSNPGGEFLVDDARTSRLYREADYDAILCTEVLEHIDDDLAVVSRFPLGTRCLCTVPNFMCNSHVRCFEDASAVAGRYGRYFAGFDVLALRGTGDQGEVYFLFDGIRNELVSG